MKRIFYLSIIVIIVIACWIFMSYPVDMDLTEKAELEKQVSILKTEEHLGNPTYAHFDLKGKRKTSKGYEIYVTYEINEFYLGKDGNIYNLPDVGSEMCLCTDKEYNIIEIKTPETFENYNESRRNLIPFPVRIRLMSTERDSLIEQDYLNAEAVLRN